MKLFQKISSLCKNEFIIHTAIVFMGTTIAGFCNFLYHLIAVRKLSPIDYGTLNALISFIGIAATPIAPLSTVLTKFFTEYITKENFADLIIVIRKLIKRMIISGIIMLIIFCIFSSLVGGFLHTKAIYVIICGVIIFLSVLSSFATSLLQSYQKFIAYSLIGFISALLKLLVSLGLFIWGLKVLGGLAGFLISPLFVLTISPIIIFSLLKHNILSKHQTEINISLTPFYKYFFSVFLTMISFTLLTNIDIILVKHFFSSIDAGYYSIAQVVGKIFLFAPAALAIVILPKAAKANVNKDNSLKILYKSLIVICLLSGTGVLFSFLFPEKILHIMTTKANPVSISLVGIYALTMSFYAGLWVIINFSLATDNLKFILPLLIITLFQGILICFWHQNLLQVVCINLIISMISFIVTFFNVLK